MAYSRYEYETSPRKLKPEYAPNRKKTAKTEQTRNVKNKKVAKSKSINQAKIILYIAIGFATLFVISYRYAVIDNTYSELSNLKTKLSSIEKENAQLEANIESSLKLTTIEEAAKEQLGMQKLSSEQIVYVTLPKTDYVECSSDEIKEDKTSSNWFMEIINKLMETLSY